MYCLPFKFYSCRVHLVFPLFFYFHSLVFLFLSSSVLHLTSMNFKPIMLQIVTVFLQEELILSFFKHDYFVSSIKRFSLKWRIKQFNSKCVQILII